MSYDVVVLTDRRYINPEETNDYINNVMYEDELVVKALQRAGMRACRKSWDDTYFDWQDTKAALFRTTWDYFDRFNEFFPWLLKTADQTQLINSSDAIHWNIDKHYLKDLESKGVAIPPTRFMKKDESFTLAAIFNLHHWEKAVLKPAVSGAARHTYVIDEDNVRAHELVFRNLIAQEDMLLQEYQETITDKGEVSIIMIDGEFTHAVLKRSKGDDFRVQDDFGGTVEPYTPTADELEFARHVIQACPFDPIYARIDYMWNTSGQPILGELELIEPELWFRHHPEAADRLAQAILRRIKP